MNETVHYKGKLKKVEIQNESNLNDYCKGLCQQLNIEENDYWKKYSNGNYIELLTDNKDEYIFIKGELYEILSKEYHDLEEEIANLSINDDGTYDYEVRYYNGGAGFNEMIEECFDRLK